MTLEDWYAIEPRKPNQLNVLSCFRGIMAYFEQEK